MKNTRNKSVSFEPRHYVPNIEKKEFGSQPVDLTDVADTFVYKLGLDKKPVTEVYKIKNKSEIIFYEKIYFIFKNYSFHLLLDIKDLEEELELAIIMERISKRLL